MNITKRKLKQLIKEELTAAMRENMGQSIGSGEAALTFEIPKRDIYVSQDQPIDIGLIETIFNSNGARIEGVVAGYYEIEMTVDNDGIDGAISNYKTGKTHYLTFDYDNAAEAFMAILANPEEAIPRYSDSDDNTADVTDPKRHKDMMKYYKKHGSL